MSKSVKREYRTVKVILAEIKNELGKPYSVLGLLHHKESEADIAKLRKHFNCFRNELYEKVSEAIGNK